MFTTSHEIKMLGRHRKHSGPRSGSVSRHAELLWRRTELREALHLVYFLRSIFRIFVEVFAGARDPLPRLSMLVREGDSQLVALRVLYVRRLSADVRLLVCVVTRALLGRIFLYSGHTAVFFFSFITFDVHGGSSRLFDGPFEVNLVVSVAGTGCLHGFPFGLLNELEELLALCARLGASFHGSEILEVVGTGRWLRPPLVLEDH